MQGWLKDAGRECTGVLLAFLNNPFLGFEYVVCVSFNDEVSVIVGLDFSGT